MFILYLPSESLRFLGFFVFHPYFVIISYEQHREMLTFVGLVLRLLTNVVSTRSFSPKK